MGVTVATPTGGVPVVDECSADPEEIDEELTECVIEVHENDERLWSPKPIAQVDAGEYDAVVSPGGYETAWDVNRDQHARQALLQAITDDDSKAFIICHTAGILGFTREADGSFLVEGHEITGFPSEWEEDIVDDDDLVPDGRELPCWVEDEVKAVGDVWDAELDSDTNVAVDGDFIAARGSGSSTTAVQALLGEL